METSTQAAKIRRHYSKSRMITNRFHNKKFNPAPFLAAADCQGHASGGALIAMSGGVDSSVTAYLMKEAGWDCYGVTMRLFSNEEICLSGKSCCSLRDVADAESVARRLGIPYKAVDMQADFRKNVIEKFIRIYEEGGTPNPCIDCNRTMKFDLLLKLARQMGLTHMATGHYARVERDENTGRFLLKKAADQNKDQSYVLYMLSQDQLAHLILPLGDKTKTEIRSIAAARGFVNANKQESQDICFVPDGDYVRFIEEYTGLAYPEGDFLDLSGNKVGTHKGAIRYTTGQRKGLGLAMGSPVYVQGKDMEKNTVTVGPEECLYETEAVVEDINWISIPDLTAPMRVMAMPRYRKKEAAATLYPLREDSGDAGPEETTDKATPCRRVRVVFDEPQRAMTSGQAMVFYDEDTVVGGGTIASVGAPKDNT